MKCLCGECKQEGDKDDMTLFDSILLCHKCFTYLVTECYECGELFWVTQTRHSGDYQVCIDCFSDSYVDCIRCGDGVRCEDAVEIDCDSYCESCAAEEDNQYLRSYDYKPYPIFYGSGTYYGIELEVDEGGEDSEIAEHLYKKYNHSDELFYIKRDGSLLNGLEIVSHPMTLDYHINNMIWRNLLSDLKFFGYKSHDTKTCGYHIHVNRSSFGKTLDEQDEKIANIIYFVDKYWDYIKTFSRRSSFSIDQWASRYLVMDDRDHALKYVKEGSKERYVCINLQAHYTIEFRIFKGTLKYETFIACLQFVDVLCTTVANMCSYSLIDFTWYDLFSNLDQTKNELTDFLKHKKLLNSPSMDRGES